MILKIKGCNEMCAAYKVKHNGWVFYDGLNHVYYDFINKEDIKDYEYDGKWLGDKDQNIALLVCAFRNDKDFVILTDQATYILSDEGKTIERIN